MNNSKSKVIAFSGGCFSGKTTTMEALRKALINNGYEVCVFSELIRNMISESIDQVRKNPVKYFELQKKIISKKINQEKHAFNTIKQHAKNKTVFLFDRAITDSLFYFENYIDKSSLPDDVITEYCKFHTQIINYAYEAFRNYSAVVEFVPLNISCNVDKFRPKNIDALKHYEYSVISMLNYYYVAPATHHIICNLNINTTDEVIECIIKECGL